MRVARCCGANHHRDDVSLLSLSVCLSGALLRDMVSGLSTTPAGTTSASSAAVLTITSTPGSEIGPINGTFTVTLSTTLPVPVLVTYTIGGNAVPGQDYAPLPGTVLVPAGQSAVTVPVVVLPNPRPGGGTVEVVLTLTGTSNPAAVTVGVPSVATVAITDALVATIAALSNGSEAGPTPAVMAVTLSGPAVTNTVIAYNVSGTAVNGTDYQPLLGFVVIPQGSSAVNITILPIPDLVVDGNKTVVLTLSTSFTPTVLIGSPSVATVIITDVDVVTVLATVPNASQIGPVDGVFTVSVAAPVTADTTVTYSLGGVPFGGGPMCFRCVSLRCKGTPPTASAT